MSGLHEKIKVEDLQGRTTLLTAEQENFVRKLEGEVQAFRDSFINIKLK